MRKYTDISVENRTILLGEYILDTGATVRAAAKKFGISKSTVHKDIRERLKKVNMEMYKGVAEILRKNKEERHIRGGIATKIKYQNKQKSRSL